MNKIFPDNFIKLVLMTSIWVNISEVFRYFLIVMPTMREELASISNVAPMDWWIFSIWGLWDTILTASIVFITWLCYKSFGTGKRTILIAGTISWGMFFLLFWIGMVNMNLANPTLLIVTLPLCLLETMVAAWITIKLIDKYHA
ncbi:MAG: hypothetical protein ACRBFS_27070 [Aureispira sp.]